MHYKGRGIELLSAHSDIEARQVMSSQSDIAVVLLDVVMETDDAGLQLVSVIREELGNTATRIILRTLPARPSARGASHRRLRHQRLQSQKRADGAKTVHHRGGGAALARNHRRPRKNPQRARKNPRQHQRAVPVHSLQQFAAGVLTQLSAFLGCQRHHLRAIRARQAARQQRTRRRPARAGQHRRSALAM